MDVPTVAGYLTEWLQRRRTDLRLDELDRRTIEQLYARLLDRGGRCRQGLAPRTIVYTQAVLHRALKDAQHDDLLTDNSAHLACQRRAKFDPLATRGFQCSSQRSC